MISSSSEKQWHNGAARAQATLLLADEWTLVTFRSPCVDQYDSSYFSRLPEGKDSPFANDDSQAPRSHEGGGLGQGGS